MIPHALIPTAGVDYLTGASVRIDDTDDGDWFIEGVLGREPVLNPATVDSDSIPVASLVLVGDQTIPAGTWTALDDLADVSGTLEAGTNGRVIIGEPGWYIIDAQANWDANSNGTRRIRVINYTTVQFNFGFKGDLLVAETDQQSGNHQHMCVLEHFDAGEEIRVEVYQNTGAGLALKGYTPVSGERVQFESRWTIRKTL